MKITFAQVEAFLKLYTQINTQEMSFATAYKFNKLYNELSHEAEFFKEKLDQLVEYYSLKLDNGDYDRDINGNIKIQPDKFQECDKKLQQLYAVEITQPSICFTLDELSKLNISPQQIDILKNYIEKET